VTRTTASAAASPLLHQPAPTPASRLAPYAAPFRGLNRCDLGTEDVGEDLAPESTGGPTTGRPNLGGCRHPGFGHEVEAVAQAERDALQDRPRQVPSVVPEGQAHEGAAGAGVRVGAAFSGQIRQKDQAVAPGRHV